MICISTLSICLFCLLQLGFMYLVETRRRNARYGQEKYFRVLLLLAMASLTADFISSLRVYDGWLYPFVYGCNFVEITLNTLLIPFFYQYLCEQVPPRSLKVRQTLSAILWSITAVSIALTASSFANGLVFYHDEAGLYHRGPLFMLPMGLILGMMCLVEGYLLSHKTALDAHDFRALALFMLAPFVGWMLQALLPGLPFALLGVTFAALVVFTNIQNRNIDKDYLTGAFNRQTLDRVLQSHIASASSRGSFSAILLDIDDFKSINDRYGHYEGDAALITAVRALREAVACRDLIARYGGDEFCVLLDTDNPAVMDATCKRIRRRIADLTRDWKKPYAIRFSIGAAVYQPTPGNDAAAFFQQIDRYMYEEKRAHATGQPEDDLSVGAPA